MADKFLHRQPVNVEGYPDDFQETFEDWIDCFTPYENIPKIAKIEFGMEFQDLENFCKKAYNMGFKDTYSYFVRKSDMYMRKAITNLAKEGNKTALSLASEHFMKLGKEEQQNNARVVINATIPIDRNSKGD